MADVFDVSDFFISQAQSNINDTITNLRLNKLLFFAQAWYLSRYSDPLFCDDIEAWDFGPVIPVVYQKYKSYGKNNIDITSHDYGSSVLSGNELQVLIDVLNYYGRFSTTELVNISHQEGGPWDMAYKEKKGTIISKDLLRSYYQKKEPLKTFNLPKWMYQNTENYTRTAGGVIKLGKDWEEDDFMRKLGRLEAEDILSVQKIISSMSF